MFSFYHPPDYHPKHKQYDQYRHLQITNIYDFRDAVLIGVANSLTSFYAGFIVFGTLGMLAEVIPKRTQFQENFKMKLVSTTFDGFAKYLKRTS